jgi:hypothetical protein
VLVALLLSLTRLDRVHWTDFVLAAHHREGTDQDTVDPAAHVDHAPAPVDRENNHVGADRKMHGQNGPAGSGLQPAGTSGLRPVPPEACSP